MRRRSVVMGITTQHAKKITEECKATRIPKYRSPCQAKQNKKDRQFQRHDPVRSNTIRVATARRRNLRAAAVSKKTTPLIFCKRLMPRWRSLLNRSMRQ